MVPDAATPGKPIPDMSLKEERKKGYENEQRIIK
jgi:hypothetical protein